MGNSVKFSRVETTLRQLSYPVSREDAAMELDEVTLLLADGEENLGELVAKTEQERYESAEDLEVEINNVLPREAVGEPYQSEGDA